ncbi:MAG: FAD-dependent thymidylate synthase [Planctomycetaceae bacterium]|nr:FAD-dependent thymidylate synthase [Planctomycetaceae bacterium]
MLPTRPPASRTFLSAPPGVRLVNSFERPFDNSVATARTCYSSRGIVTAEEVAGVGEEEAVRAKRTESRDRIARSIYQAGHHTTLQHASFQFALSEVSRQFLWSFLHAHPFYNSEQVSQRYVEVKEGSFAVPALEGEALSVYRSTCEGLTADYFRLIEVLERPVEAALRRRFPRRAGSKREARDVQKKSQEAARYVLPLATHAYLYHTVSGLTLLRYHRLCEQHDAPAETRLVVGRMVEELLARDPAYAAILEEPIPLGETPEARFYEEAGGPPSEPVRRAFVEEFDRDLGGRTSKLVDRKARNEETVAQAVRDVLGLPRTALSDDDALLLVLDPARNALLGENMNVTTHGKLSRALFHASWTFRKRISHTADSQDQRHRMTPAARPLLFAYMRGEPDFVVPGAVEGDGAASLLFRASMERAWAGVERLRALGVAPEWCAYLLPNAVAVRFTESSDLLNLHHKMKMRLCWNAQEEIWKASRDEAEQVLAADPRIGRWLLPPCGIRARSGARPICPEGDRYCGVPVWRMSLEEQARAV